MAKQNEGKKGCKKMGRKARSASQQNYKLVRRSEINREKRIAKDKRNHGKVLKVPCGTARAARREGLQLAYAAQHGIPSTGE